MLWLYGRPYAPPGPLADALHELFGPVVRQVRLFEHSAYARLHGARAVTRPGRIHVAVSGAEFVADLVLVLHEYCHVLHQWQPGRLTRTGYLWETLRRGYWRNRFEVEARLFAARELGTLRAALARQGERLA